MILTHAACHDVKMSQCIPYNELIWINFDVQRLLMQTENVHVNVHVNASTRSENIKVKCLAGEAKLK